MSIMESRLKEDKTIDTFLWPYGADTLFCSTRHYLCCVSSSLNKLSMDNASDSGLKRLCAKTLVPSITFKYHYLVCLRFTKTLLYFEV